MVSSQRPHPFTGGVPRPLARAPASGAQVSSGPFTSSASFPSPALPLSPPTHTPSLGRPCPEHPGTCLSPHRPHGPGRPRLDQTDATHVRFSCSASTHPAPCGPVAPTLPASTPHHTAPPRPGPRAHRLGPATHPACGVHEPTSVTRPADAGCRTSPQSPTRARQTPDATFTTMFSRCREKPGPEQNLTKVQLRTPRGHDRNVGSGQCPELFKSPL